MLITALLVLGVGIISGFLNSLASSGSAFVLPLFILMGVPPNIANGTNRVAVMIGSAVATYRFFRAKKLPWRPALLLLIPTALGAFIGAYLATILNPKWIAWSVAIGVLIALIVLLSKLRKLFERDSTDPDAIFKLTPFNFIVFTFIGIWSGYIVLDSATWLLLGLILLAGLDLVRANGVKNFLLLMTGLGSIIVFGIGNDINWMLALYLSIGSVIGSWMGCYVGVQERLRKWVFRALIFALTFEALSLIIRLLITQNVFSVTV